VRQKLFGNLVVTSIEFSFENAKHEIMQAGSESWPVTLVIGGETAWRISDFSNRLVICDVPLWSVPQ
jgi:hypothetical protein